MIRNHGDEKERQALILLRRGRFMAEHHEGGVHEQHPHYTPYMVGLFRGAGYVSNLRGLDPQDIEFRAVQEHSFLRPAGQMQKETVVSVIDMLREKIGLSFIDYEEPPVRSLSLAILTMARTSIPLRIW